MAYNCIHNGCVYEKKINICNNHYRLWLNELNILSLQLKVYLNININLTEFNKKRIKKRIRLFYVFSISRTRI